MNGRATHYLPGKETTGASWCGRMVGFHPGIPATKDPKRVTCLLCRRSMDRWERMNPGYSAKVVS